jgi:hypothetical protein
MAFAASSGATVFGLHHRRFGRPARSGRTLGHHTERCRRGRAGWAERPSRPRDGRRALRLRRQSGWGERGARRVWRREGEQQDAAGRVVEHLTILDRERLGGGCSGKSHAPAFPTAGSLLVKTARLVSMAAWRSVSIAKSPHLKTKRELPTGHPRCRQSLCRERVSAKVTMEAIVARAGAGKRPSTDGGRPRRPWCSIP